MNTNQTVQPKETIQNDKRCADWLQRCVRRPKIGELVIVHGFMLSPFKARVRSYRQCNDDSMVVTRYRTREEWVVKWENCSPNESSSAMSAKTK